MKLSHTVALCCTALVATVTFDQRAWGQGEARQHTQEARPGVILLVEGVGGIQLMHATARIGFRHAGLPHEVRPFSWSHGPGRFLRDLQDIRHVLAKGEELAGEIRALKQTDPELRVFVVAHSGGTGVAVRAAELLPPDCVERLILLSSALSPDYDLRPALSAAKQGIVSYYSPHDCLILGWGTRQFGTIDRAYGPSAGYVGFRVPPHLSAADQALHTRLVQVPWDPPMIWHGNWGNHNGTIFPSFLAGEVARWLR